MWISSQKQCGLELKIILSIENDEEPKNGFEMPGTVKGNIKLSQPEKIPNKWAL